MKTAAIREKLTDYIKVADDEKIKAMYVLLKEEMTVELAWWKDSDFLNELDADHQQWKSGQAKGFSIDEVMQAIALKRQNGTIS